MTRRALLLLAGLWPVAAVRAHDTRLGDVVIDHPYALPSAAGSREAAVHFRALRHRGAQPDRLIEAQTPMAAQVLIRQRAAPDQPWQTVPALALAPGASLATRHDGLVQLWLQGLKAPLVDGDRLPLQLRFEQAGSTTVSVWVQTPRR